MWYFQFLFVWRSTCWSYCLCHCHFLVNFTILYAIVSVIDFYCLCHCSSYCLGVNIASAGVCQIQKYISKSEFSKKIVIFRGQMMPYILLMKTIKRREEKEVPILIAITILKDRFTDFECTTSSTPSIRVHRCVWWTNGAIPSAWNLWAIFD